MTRCGTVCVTACSGLRAAKGVQRTAVPAFQAARHLLKSASTHQDALCMPAPSAAWCGWTPSLQFRRASMGRNRPVSRYHARPGKTIASVLIAIPDPPSRRTNPSNHECPPSFNHCLPQACGVIYLCAVDGVRRRRRRRLFGAWQRSGNAQWNFGDSGRR